MSRLQDEDEGIAVEACEFWTAFCESEVDKDVLRPSLPRVLPVLLKNMVGHRAGQQLSCNATSECAEAHAVFYQALPPASSHPHLTHAGI